MWSIGAAVYFITPLPESAFETTATTADAASASDADDDSDYHARVKALKAAKAGRFRFHDVDFCVRTRRPVPIDFTVLPAKTFVTTCPATAD